MKDAVYFGNLFCISARLASLCEMLELEPSLLSMVG